MTANRGLRTTGSIALLLLLTEAVYLPFSVLTGKKTLFGWDYQMLHLRRLAFARDALFGSAHTLPAWSPREFLGAPFAANLQSFPWIPTHWLLLVFDPERAYAVAIALAAGLAAVFTFAYCRQLGLGRVASIAAGWTFACAGFFSARVEVGHLSILEAYPGLPLLLLAVERAVAAHSTRSRRTSLALIAIVSACLAVAGHPQLPAYSLGAALVYGLWRSPGRLRARIAGALVLGAAASAVVWWPMVELIRRSTRVLPLRAALNDIVLPYHRLLAFFQPGIDGWPAGVRLAAAHPFTGYPHPGYFWDTVGYVGVLPWMAVAMLAIRCAVRKRLPAQPWIILAVLAVASLLAALPVFAPLRDAVPGTLLRSPARLLYLVTFSLAMALGAGVDTVLQWARIKKAPIFCAALAVCLGLHGFDLARFARLFLVPVARNELETPALDRLIAREKQPGRIAVSRAIALEVNSRYDDAGGFDSIFLADPYRAFVQLSGSPPGLNEEVMDASMWPLPALRAASVQFVVTPAARPDLEPIGSTFGINFYRVANPAPRAAFVPANQARVTVNGVSLLPQPTGTVAYTRPSSDEIILRLAARQPGFLYLLEAGDPGWRALADDNPAPILKANGFGMALPLDAGAHTVVFRYQTPGRTTGALITLGSLLLAALLRGSARFRGC
jgi:hypothetical protein